MSSTITVTNTNKHAGKVALVTGGSTGIGFATARRLIDEGAHVYITGRRKAELDRAVAELGAHATGIQADSASLADLDRVYAKIKADEATLDILFANAGVAESKPLAEVTEAHYDTIFDINVKGLLFTVQKALPLLKDGASIILNASVVGSLGNAGSSVYSATKAAVRSFARTWTSDLKARKIRVNAVSPGPVLTPGLANLAPDEASAQQLLTAFASAVPMGRLGEPDEIAKAVSFLASDDASFITGIELFVDGGVAQV